MVFSVSVVDFDQVNDCWVINKFEQVFAQGVDTYQIVS